MTTESTFVRFSVLLSGVWASQCEHCGHVIFVGQDEDELSLAEAAHQCPTEKPNTSVSTTSHRA